MKTLLALALFAIPSLANAANIYDFAGSYKLVKGVYGICEEQTRLFVTGDIEDEQNGVNLSIGGYFFPHINTGTRRSDNEITRESDTATFKGNRVVYRQVSFNKLSRETTTTVRSITRVGNRITFSSIFSGPVSGETVCIFTKVADPETNF